MSWELRVEKFTISLCRRPPSCLKLRYAHNQFAANLTPTTDEGRYHKLATSPLGSKLNSWISPILSHCFAKNRYKVHGRTYCYFMFVVQCLSQFVQCLSSVGFVLACVFFCVGLCFFCVGLCLSHVETVLELCCCMLWRALPLS